jgi:hypothetical protein
MEEPSYASLQREVQRKLGRCLIRIQQYELLLKEMVSKREVSTILGRNPARLAEKSSAVAVKTMGQLVGELTNKFFQPTLSESGDIQREGSPSDDEKHPAGRACVRISVSITPDAHEQITAELQNLVDLRNNLVHHFVEGQDLVTEEGCITADMYLQDCYAEIDRHLVSLRGWAESSNDAMGTIIAFMASPEYKDFLMTELSPSTSLREAALPRLVELIRRAETVVAKDGWTALSAAIAFAKTVAPAETPKKNTFRSWRQVLSEANVFEVRRGPVSPGGPMETWYRSLP